MTSTACRASMRSASPASCATWISYPSGRRILRSPSETWRSSSTSRSVFALRAPPCTRPPAMRLPGRAIQDAPRFAAPCGETPREAECGEVALIELRSAMGSRFRVHESVRRVRRRERCDLDEAAITWTVMVGDRLDDAVGQAPEAHEIGADAPVIGADDLELADGDGTLLDRGRRLHAAVVLGQALRERELADVVKNARLEGFRLQQGVARLELRDALGEQRRRHTVP